MKKNYISGFLLIALATFLLVSCNYIDGEATDMSQISGKTYVWEKPGFGSDFTLTINEDGSFSYYVGAYSSHIGLGSWTLENGIVKLIESVDVFQFKVENNGLTFLSDGSAKFMYVDVKDGDQFFPRKDVVVSDFPSTEGASELSASPASYTQISQEEAQRMMELDDDHIILDVRRQDEYDSGHIPGAICIPNETIGTEMLKELPDLDQVILVYCRSGKRSKEAAQKLYDIGYTHVFEFGGIIDWTGEITAGR